MWHRERPYWGHQGAGCPTPTHHLPRGMRDPKLDQQNWAPGSRAIINLFYTTTFFVMQLDLPSSIYIAPITKSSSLWADEIPKDPPSPGWNTGYQDTALTGESPAGCPTSSLGWRVWRDVPGSLQPARSLISPLPLLGFHVATPVSSVLWHRGLGCHADFLANGRQGPS